SGLLISSPTGHFNEYYFDLHFYLIIYTMHLGFTINLLQFMIIIAWLPTSGCQADEKYEGLFLNEFTSYAHQVQGSVYAVDEYTLLIKNFFYDGNGQDTYFWAGSTSRPSNVGFIVPDEEGRTNTLMRYSNEDFTLSLPDRKKITEVKWLSVYDLSSNNNFADIYIPEGFNAPAPQKLAELTRFGGGVHSGPVYINDSKTIEIKDFHLDSDGSEIYFIVGNGPTPGKFGTKIPDETGYYSRLQSYDEKDITLELPGKMTVFNVNWLSVWNNQTHENYGHVMIPDGLNIPPSLVEVIDVRNALIKVGGGNLPNCEQLHRRFQIHWDVFGPQITFALVGQIDYNDYMAFGISGSEKKSQMEGSDIVMTYMKDLAGFVEDYNITALSPCTNTLGRYKGVCNDLKVGGLNNYQLNIPERKDGVTTITYRRGILTLGDDGDKEFDIDNEQYFVWAIGKLNKFNEPAFHYLYPKGNVKLRLGRSKDNSSCHQFTTIPDRHPSAWGPFYIYNKNVDTLNIRIGPAGITRGYIAHTGKSPGSHAFYVNGLLSPEIYVKRGKKYKFVVEAGNNPHDSLFYHPFYITENPYGGFGLLSVKEV
ncbi:Uncharacterised protein PB.1026, partial [Pycnogonum litorale]